MTERKRFENYCLTKGIEHNSFSLPDGTVMYYNMIANALWEAWKAALEIN